MLFSAQWQRYGCQQHPTSVLQNNPSLNSISQIPGQRLTGLAWPRHPCPCPWNRWGAQDCCSIIYKDKGRASPSPSAVQWSLLPGSRIFITPTGNPKWNRTNYTQRFAKSWLYVYNYLGNTAFHLYFPNKFYCCLRLQDNAWCHQKCLHKSPYFKNSYRNRDFGWKRASTQQRPIMTFIYYWEICLYNEVRKRTTSMTINKSKHFMSFELCL